MARLELSEAVKALIAKEIYVDDEGMLRTKEFADAARNSAIATVISDVTRFLTLLAEKGFGICFYSLPVMDSSKPHLHLQRKALRAALFEEGIETDDSNDFVRFVNDERRAVAESRISDDALTALLEQAPRSLSICDKRTAEAKVTIEKESVRKSLIQTQIRATFDVLGKRSWIKDAQEAKRARTDDAGGVGGADA